MPIAEKDNNCVNFWCRKSLGNLTMCQPATKRIVLAFLIYFMSKLNSLMKEMVPKRDLWSKYGTKSAAVGLVNKLPTMMKDVRVSGWFFPTFAQIIWWYRCHNLPQTTWLHESTNINANMWLRQRNLLYLWPLTYFHRSLYVHIKLHATTSQMQPRRYRSISWSL